MKIEESIYPYYPEAERLPFFLAGIGGSEYQGHIHRPDGYQWHQILFCIKGRGILKYGNEKMILAENDCVFLPKESEHEYYPEGDAWEVRWIAFDGFACGETLKQLGMNQPVVVGGNDGGLERIFDRMVISQRTDILYCGYSCSGLVYDCLLEFHRGMEKDMAGARSKKLSMLLPALRFMHDHYSQDFSFVFLSQMLDITPQHFCRLFRETLRMKPGDYLTGIRISEAKRLLRETDLLVSEISARCGFNDPGYFSTVFRKKEGITPADFKKRKYP